jgi:hypothetical protein
MGRRLARRVSEGKEGKVSGRSTGGRSKRVRPFSGEKSITITITITRTIHQDE